MPKQMRRPDGLRPDARVALIEIGAGCVASIEERDKKEQGLFYVSWSGELQVMFPILEDGTVARIGTMVGDNPYATTDVFRPSSIPGLQTKEGRIVWSDERPS